MCIIATPKHMACYGKALKTINGNFQILNVDVQIS